MGGVNTQMVARILPNRALGSSLRVLKNGGVDIELSRMKVEVGATQMQRWGQRVLGRGGCRSEKQRQLCPRRGAGEQSRGNSLLCRDPQLHPS